jgi:uncharacterized oligopeptide transporter (OPT) family protein
MAERLREHCASDHDRDETSPLLDRQNEEHDLVSVKRTTSSLILPCEGFAWRSVILGGFIGSAVCLTNMHFGLQTGYINIMSMPSALIGYGVFEFIKKHLAFPFSPAENVLIQTVASSVGAMPAAAGLVGAIPALELLISPADGGPAKTSLLGLCIWSLGISAFGLLFAVMLRERIILKERLRFPTGTATALMVNVLHSEKSQTRQLSHTGSHSSRESGRRVSLPVAEETRNQRSRIDDSEASKPQAGLKSIFVAMFLSGFYVWR